MKRAGLCLLESPEPINTPPSGSYMATGEEEREKQSREGKRESRREGGRGRRRRAGDGVRRRDGRMDAHIIIYLYFICIYNNTYM